MTEKPKPHPNSLEGVPGLGPISIAAINKNGVFEAIQLKCKSPIWLKEVTGMDKDKAGEIFDYITKRLEDAGLISKRIMSATEASKEREKIRRLSTNCKAFDRMLGGGIECGSITEIYGENGSGKTQLGHTLCVQAQLPVDQGGLFVHGEKKPVIFYINTENTFRPERIDAILAGRGLIPKIPQKLLTKAEEGIITEPERAELEAARKEQAKEAKKWKDYILVQRVSDAYNQAIVITNLLSMMHELNIKLIIVDSGTELFRSQYLGLGNSKAKFDLLNECVTNLKVIAENYNVPILFVNQIYHSPDQFNPGDIPYGGNIVGHKMPTRIQVWKSGRKHKARLVKSPYLENTDCEYQITDAGVVDVE